MKLIVSIAQISIIFLFLNLLFIFIHQNVSLFFAFISKQPIILNHISICGKQYQDLPIILLVRLDTFVNSVTSFWSNYQCQKLIVHYIIMHLNQE